MYFYNKNVEYTINHFNTEMSNLQMARTLAQHQSGVRAAVNEPNSSLKNLISLLLLYFGKTILHRPYCAFQTGTCNGSCSECQAPFVTA